MSKAALIRRTLSALLLASVTATGLGFSAPANAAPVVLAKQGDHNTLVLSIENKLVAVRKLAVGLDDSYYTAETTQAVRTIQGQVGLPVTGSVDEATNTALNTLWVSMGRPSPENPIIARSGSRGTTVKRLQDILSGIKLLGVGKNTGVYDQNTVNAVTTLQRQRGIPVTGVINLVTYKQLLVVWYAQGKPAPAKPAPGPILARPGNSGALVKRVQGMLIGIKFLAAGYNSGKYDRMTTNAVQAFQRSKGLAVSGNLDRTTYNAIMAAWTAQGKPLPPGSASAPKLDSRCLVDAKVLCINKTTHKLYYVKGAQIQRSFDIRVGRPGYSTREGTFSVYFKDVKSWSRPYQVWMPYSMYFSGGQAVHYSYEFANYGYLQGSHGCVNMRDWNGIAWLYSQIPVGTKVVVYS